MRGLWWLGGLCPTCTVPDGKCLGTKTNDVHCTGAASTICDYGEMIIVAKVVGVVRVRGAEKFTRRVFI